MGNDTVNDRIIYIPSEYGTIAFTVSENEGLPTARDLDEVRELLEERGPPPTESSTGCST